MEISSLLRDRVRLCYVSFESLAVGPPDPELAARIDGAAAALRRELGGRRLATLEGVRRTRRLYRRLGIDPTRDRPRSERLLRRVLRELPLRGVNTLLDAVSLAGIRFQCPAGAYDRDLLEPPLQARVGEEGEEQQTEDGDTLRLAGRPLLADRAGAFGGPSVDPARALPTPRTRRAVVVAWTTVDASREYTDGLVGEVVRLAREFCDARVECAGVVGGRDTR